MTSTIKAPAEPIQVIEWPAELTASITRLANAVADKLKATEVTNSMGTVLEGMYAELGEHEERLDTLEAAKRAKVLEEEVQAAERFRSNITFAEQAEDEVRGDPEYVACAKVLELLSARIRDPKKEAIESYKNAYAVVDSIAREYYGYW
jgi:hypothetical protein